MLKCVACSATVDEHSADWRGSGGAYPRAYLGRKKLLISRAL
jgi:hypothetical protein